MTGSLESLPRYSLASLPTPLQPLPRLSQQLGVDLWVKRDDLTGLAFGGNKTRKLELLVAEALDQGAETLVTTGAIQSNHCRQTAAAAAKAGLDCALLLVGEADPQAQGNLLLDHLMGADIHYTTKDQQPSDFDQLIANLAEQGRRPYRIPYGGSNPLGVAAYALALKELIDQGPEFDLIVVASSSGGTQAGLILGSLLYSFSGEVLGISIEPAQAELATIIQELLASSIDRFEVQLKASEARIQVNDRFLGLGYAQMGDLEHEAIKLFAEQEGLLLDPVYTGRAAGGLISLIEAGAIEPAQRVLFWHTGGTPALFAYNRALTS